VLPPMPILRPEHLMEFRAENATALKTFRRSMLQYAGNLNSKIKDVSSADFDHTTKFFIQTEIVPVMDALRSWMNDPAGPWYNRVTDHAKVLAELGASFFALDPTTAIARALAKYAGVLGAELTALWVGSFPWVETWVGPISAEATTTSRTISSLAIPPRAGVPGSRRIYCSKSPNRPSYFMLSTALAFATFTSSLPTIVFLSSVSAFFACPNPPPPRVLRRAMLDSLEPLTVSVSGTVTPCHRSAAGAASPAQSRSC
jgi:hypothetical protein